MEPDEEGFFYPVVNEKECINCHKCETVCPIINKTSKRFPLNAKIIQSKDSEDLSHCSSGGFFATLAKYVILKQGIVYGVGLDESLKVTHMRATSLEQINKFRGSKYVQSDIVGTFQKVKMDLQAGCLVCFSGTPCQVSGLLCFLSKKYENLITFEVVCHGVSSPLLWKKYKNSFSHKIVSSNFRSKHYGYKHGVMAHAFDNGGTYYQSGRTDPFLKCFFSEISSRPSCYVCHFKDQERVSDFTVFDCWSFSKITHLTDNNLGYSNVFINSEKGQSLFSKISKDFFVFESDIKLAITLDGAMYNQSAKQNMNRDCFFQYLKKHSVNKTVKKFLRIHWYDRLIETSKCFFFR
jgi:coenzyme F420-reducing hydrogenase beta subunit